MSVKAQQGRPGGFHASTCRRSTCWPHGATRPDPSACICNAADMKSGGTVSLSAYFVKLLVFCTHG